MGYVQVRSGLVQGIVRVTDELHGPTLDQIEPKLG
jgi:hypothetical protein